MADNKNNNCAMGKQLVNILDDISNLKMHAEGTEQLLLALYDSFRSSSRTLEEFTGAVLVIHEIVGGYVETLDNIDSKIKAVMDAA